MKMKLTYSVKPSHHYSLKQVQSLAFLSMNQLEVDKTVLAVAEENPLLEISPTYFTKGAIPLPDSLSNQEPSLMDELLFQCNTSSFQHKKTARYLIQCLDSNGYLTIPLSTLKKDLSISMSQLKKALAFIQTLSPKGVGATTLKECLEIQCRDLKTSNSDLLIKTLSYLPDLAKGHFKKVACTCQSSEKEIRHCFELIKTCNPKPGASFASLAPTLIPEISITLEEEQLLIQIQDITQFITLNSPLSSSDKEATDYLKKKTQQIHTLLHALHKRNKTLHEVCRVIIDAQQDFFIHGAALKPLTYQAVATLLQRHPSTIFRCVQAKAFLFNQQVYLLSSLFSNEVCNGVSSDWIKKQILHLIENEDKNHPLTDQQLLTHFQQNNITVSRRALAKYRNQLHIPNSFQRKIKP